MLTGLPAIGITDLAPADGAFYIWADVSRWTEDSLSWCRRLLSETGVAVAPGIDFDPVNGGRFIRLSFAGEADVITDALAVLGEWLKRR